MRTRKFLKNNLGFPARPAYLPFKGANKLRVPVGQNGGLRVLFKPAIGVVPSLEAGPYSGTVAVNLDNGSTIDIPIEVEVLELVLPQKPYFGGLTPKNRFYISKPAYWYGFAKAASPATSVHVDKLFSDTLLASFADHRIAGNNSGVFIWYHETEKGSKWGETWMPQSMVKDGDNYKLLSPYAGEWPQMIDHYMVPNAGPAQSMDKYGIWQPPIDPVGRFYRYSVWHNWGAVARKYAPTGSHYATKDTATAGYQDKAMWEEVHKGFHQQMAADLKNATRDVFSAPFEPYWYIDENRHEGANCQGSPLAEFADRYIEAYNLAAPFGWLPMLTTTYPTHYSYWRQLALSGNGPKVPPGLELRHTQNFRQVRDDVIACANNQPCAFTSVTPTLMSGKMKQASSGFLGQIYRITGYNVGAGLPTFVNDHLAPPCVKYGNKGALKPIVCPEPMPAIAPTAAFESLRDAFEDYDYIKLLEKRQAIASTTKMVALPNTASTWSGPVEPQTWKYFRPTFVAETETANILMKSVGGSATLHVRANGAPSFTGDAPAGEQCQAVATDGKWTGCDVPGPAYVYVAVETSDATVEVTLKSQSPAGKTPVAKRVLDRIETLAWFEAQNWLLRDGRLTTDMAQIMTLRDEVGRSFEVYAPAP